MVYPDKGLFRQFADDVYLFVMTQIALAVLICVSENTGGALQINVAVF